MRLFQKLLQKLNGLHYPQEFLCLAKETFPDPLHAYLVDDDKVVRDITDRHLFTGYHPLIFTLPIPVDEDGGLARQINIVFSQRVLLPNDHIGQKDAIALLSMKWIRTITIGDLNLYYFEGIHGDHSFLSAFHQYIIGLNNRLYKKKPGNVYLAGNLYKQVEISYAIPRNISMISLAEGDLFNLFPTDLHGPAGDKHYVGSLRHEGKACGQVEQNKRILISQVHVNTFKTAYGLGKNHMQDPKQKSHFPFAEMNSTTLQLPLPLGALFYRELELKESFIHGIHKLFVFEIISVKSLSSLPATLVHINSAYATWRFNKGLAGNYLLR